MTPSLTSHLVPQSVLCYTLNGTCIKAAHKTFSETAFTVSWTQTPSHFHLEHPHPPPRIPSGHFDPIQLMRLANRLSNMRLATTILYLALGSVTTLAAPTNDTPDHPTAQLSHYTGESHPEEHGKRNTAKWRIGPCQFGGGHRNCQAECLATAEAGCTGTTGSLGWLGCSTQRSEVLQCWCSCTI